MKTALKNVHGPDDVRRGSGPSKKPPPQGSTRLPASETVLTAVTRGAKALEVVLIECSTRVVLNLDLVVDVGSRHVPAFSLASLAERIGPELPHPRAVGPSPCLGAVESPVLMLPLRGLGYGDQRARLV